MRKNFALFTGTLLFVLLIAGTNIIAETIKINKSVDGITNVVLASYGNLVITQGSENTLTIETTKNNEDNVITQAEGSRLILKTKNKDCGISSFWGLFGCSDKNKLTYYLTLKTINEISNDGSGKITAKSDITSKNLKLKLEGSGDIELKTINASNLDLICSGSGEFDAHKMIVDNHTSIKLNGSGNIEVDNLITDSLDSKLTSSANIELSGRAKSQNLTCSGSGNYSAQDLKSETAVIELSGSGDATVNVVKSISISTSGSGSVKVIGKPSVSSLNTSGSGSLSFDN